MILRKDHRTGRIGTAIQYLAQEPVPCPVRFKEVTDKTGDARLKCRYHARFCVQGVRGSGRKTLENS
jgi:hypothetical protein